LKYRWRGYANPAKNEAEMCLNAHAPDSARRWRLPLPVIYRDAGLVAKN
jgi:hypothetical protein